MTLHSAANFFVYCAFSRRFRQGLVRRAGSRNDLDGGRSIRNNGCNGERRRSSLHPIANGPTANGCPLAARHEGLAHTGSDYTKHWNQTLNRESSNMTTSSTTTTVTGRSSSSERQVSFQGCSGWRFPGNVVNPTEPISVWKKFRIRSLTTEIISVWLTGNHHDAIENCTMSQNVI